MKELWPLWKIEIEACRWSSLKFPKDSPVHEMFPQTSDTEYLVCSGGDEIRWGEVALTANKIAYRDITVTFRQGGKVLGFLAVYGQIRSEWQLTNNDGLAVGVEPVPEWARVSIADDVRDQFCWELRQRNPKISEASANAMADAHKVVFLTDDGWTMSTED